MKIKELILYTNNIERQIDFYVKVLNLPVLEKSADSVCFQVGVSVLIFKYRDRQMSYHVAFNIPSNKEFEALNWLKGKVKVIPFEGSDLIDFKKWNAKSMYFYDADMNIMEFISREDIEENAKEDFSSNSILSISEIGIGTRNIRKVYDGICTLNPIAVYDGDFDKFCALGDEHGLFI